MLNCHDVQEGGHSHLWYLSKFSSVFWENDFLDAVFGYLNFSLNTGFSIIKIYDIFGHAIFKDNIWYWSKI